MNRALITTYAHGATPEGIKNLITLFEVIFDQRNRAEATNATYLHTIKKLSESFTNITEPKTYVGIERPIPKQPTPTTPKQPKPTPPSLLDLDL